LTIVSKNKDKYWFDNSSESKPDDDKWVRSASGTPLGKLQKRINQKVLFLGIGIGRNSLYSGVKIRSKMAKLIKSQIFPTKRDEP
jgi:hypothetical protein